ncbi:carboxymuconolactone decarboxylase family protein [Sphingomonas alpina]|uniref:Carboxymuconolactone decarboxylase family protein n=2 Tax=Sphingomonas alpina TaxID=653931 RepID=A0A7H0LQX6_9SPHN|nr:carboxymuconolactone decarboxylase family protein [Sphingomonas alpina]
MPVRIAPASAPWSPAVASAFERLPQLQLFRVLARDERLFSRFVGGGLLDPGHISLRHRELAILRVCALNGSDYEWGVHVGLLSAAAGLTAAEVSATAATGAQDHQWIAQDGVIIRLCDALQSRCDIDEELWSDLAGHFDEMAILELLMLIGKYRQVCILTNALKLDLENGMPSICS